MHYISPVLIILSGSYKELSSINPRLIYASITGFGTTGPYRNRPGYDVMVRSYVYVELAVFY